MKRRNELLKKVDAEAASLRSFERRVFRLAKTEMGDKVGNFPLFRIDLDDELSYAWRHGWTPAQAFDEFVK